MEVLHDETKVVKLHTHQSYSSHKANEYSNKRKCRRLVSKGANCVPKDNTEEEASKKKKDDEDEDDDDDAEDGEDDEEYEEESEESDDNESDDNDYGSQQSGDDMWIGELL